MQCSLLHCLAKYPGSGHCMPWGSTAQEPKIQSPKIKSHHPPLTHSPFSSLRDLHIVRRMHELYSVACFSHSAASCVYMHCERVNEHGTCVASAELSLPQSVFLFILSQSSPSSAIFFTASKSRCSRFVPYEHDLYTVRGKGTCHASILSVHVQQVVSTLHLCSGNK